MSLINQMLRDLEQRTPKTPEPAEPLKIRTASNTGGKPNRFWFIALLALPAFYAWQNRPSQPLTPTIPATGKATPNQVQTGAIDVSPALAATAPTPAATTTIMPPAPAPLPPSPQTEAQAATPAPQIAAAVPEKPLIKPAPPAKPAEKSPENPGIKPAAAPLKPEKSATPRQQAEALYRQAQQSASLPAARDFLRTALEIDPLYLPARTLLLQTLLKSHASDAEIGFFAENSLQLFPGNLLFIKTRAHLYVQQKNFKAAVNLLEQIDTDSVEDSAYLSLLAAGYQQLQAFPQASRIYQKLTQIQPDKAENWLGLAVALDKLNQTQPAAQAYRQALDKNSLNSQVVDYINQRLSALN